jgi:hypothetical protein
MRRLLLSASLLFVLLPAAGASAKTYDLPAVLGGKLHRIAAATDVPVLLPDHLALDYGGRLYGEAAVMKGGFAIGFDGAPDCGGANACSLASVTAQRGGRPGYKRTVRLRGGVTGYFKPLTCGGSCSPPELQFVHAGVLYGIAAKVPGQARRRLVRAANEALAAGDRSA